MDSKTIETGTDGAAVIAQPGMASSSGGVATGALMCLMSMSSIQFGAALSSSAIATYGPAGASWLRLAFAATILAIFVRPRIVSYTRAQWTSALVLGTTTALMTMSFFAAIERIPLGLAVAIDFLGPLSVATIGYGLGRRLIWPLLAGLGVLALAHDGEGWVGNIEGIVFALGAGTGWAIYIVLTKKIGASFKGLEGLSMSLMVAALVATPFGFAGAVPALDAYGLIEMAGLAILVPLLPYTLELIALRRMPTTSFGILMSLEPAIAALAGFVILAQPMTLLQMAGTALVVAASAGATFSARQ
ncbi:inner membrane transporter RhtA [Rhizobium leguminosarum]|uniref:Inner membrane transporter RhtA n=1 Tax=Rhizobium leguminosarum TaxID=384 RepID=A0AAE2MES8_RHILE|nr:MULTISPECIES: EamA family transporter [Rhizobium]MBB4288016.1 inner membrane transporter RhtA [Rhizobium leguminosarum]MBB4295893.1 inner membrane transporter RhtA [Rhizobium leguminosarum]MBB4307285.1 inner membrane transporter RhtA [Rhizobium leguminosarum]MBB4417132.1 inner membrane transporter RhtA [Rhizobium leguminosarum]MBB4431976.1 inner membrane transporter RhtA [Rhizobium esperanzae]